MASSTEDSSSSRTPSMGSRLLVAGSWLLVVAAAATGLGLSWWVGYASTFAVAAEEITVYLLMLAVQGLVTVAPAVWLWRTTNRYARGLAVGVFAGFGYWLVLAVLFAGAGGA